MLHIFLHSVLEARAMNKFAFSLSEGASGSLLTIWNCNLFYGEVICVNRFSITVKFTSLIFCGNFHLTNVYGPSTQSGKSKLCVLAI